MQSSSSGCLRFDRQEALVEVGRLDGPHISVDRLGDVGSLGWKEITSGYGLKQDVGSPRTTGRGLNRGWPWLSPSLLPSSSLASGRSAVAGTAFVTAGPAPYDEVGIEVNRRLLEPPRAWGCEGIKERFPRSVPPFGCQPGHI